MCEAEGEPLASYLSTSDRIVVQSVADVIMDGELPINAACVAVERELVPRFSETYLACEDWEWWLRLSTIAPVAVVCEPGWQHHVSAGARALHGEASRLAFSRRLLVDHADYFASHPRARAYRWKRIGLRERNLGNGRAARRAFKEAFSARPSARTAYHYLRSIGVSSPSVA
jgi:hypothetical protein